MPEIPVVCPRCHSEDTFNWVDSGLDPDGISVSTQFHCNECEKEFIAVYAFQQSFKCGE